MTDFEQVVTEEVTENVEQTTEETEVVEQEERKFTQTEVNEMIRRNVSRNEAKIRKQYERQNQKYRDLEDVLRAGTGKENLDDMTSTFREFYEKKGITMPTGPKYTDRDTEVLANAEADEIIGYGFEEVVDEVDRLARLGVENMSAREKMVFKKLAEYRQNAEQGRELAKIGVTEDVYSSTEFKDFASQFNSKTPVTKIYEIYNKMQPRKEVHTMGSMKNNVSDEGTIKDFYSRDEALKFTKKDFDNNPALYKAVQQSMLKWGKQR